MGSDTEVGLRAEIRRLEGAVERLRAERDDWKSRWVQLHDAAAAVVDAESPSKKMLSCLASAVLVTDPIVNAVAIVATAEAGKEEGE